MNRLGENPSYGIQKAQQFSPARTQPGSMLLDNSPSVFKGENCLLLRMSRHVEMILGGKLVRGCLGSGLI